MMSIFSNKTLPTLKEKTWNCARLSDSLQKFCLVSSSKNEQILEVPIVQALLAL